MKKYLSLLKMVSLQHWKLLVLVSIGFVVFYYVALLLLTMLRFGEIPNYVVFHPVFHVYGLIMEGTPSIIDAIPIIMGEPWLETGYKNPAYYGVATWSYMLIPPKMLLVFLMGLLLGLFAVTVVYARRTKACQLKDNKKLYAAAGVSSTFISLTSATLTWVVCCATPSWSVALAMLGMSASLALWLEPLGTVLTSVALILMVYVIFYELKLILKSQESNIDAVSH